MKYRNLSDIIFSGKRSFRWKRHLLFWLAVLFYHLMRIGIMMPAFTWHSFFSMLELVIFWGVIINMMLSYSVVYFLVPRYFQRKKYFLFTIGLIMLYFLIIFMMVVHTLIFFGGPVSTAIHGGLPIANLWSIFRPGVIRDFGNPPLICCLFLSIKTLKNWHLEQLKTETLVKENANAELQLLKAQVHPHFLFNTLNNIYSFSLSHSPQAGKLVNKLSGLLGYMVHECDHQLVPLEKEIKLIRDYIGLEKVRYGNRLNMEVEIEGDYKNKLITPLLMIPFIENCFKHGVSMMRGQQWIRLNIHIDDDRLKLNLGNSKPQQITDSNAKNGIGLVNVHKRLQLIYPDQHVLIINETQASYTVQLQVAILKESSENVEYTSPDLKYEIV